MVLLFLALVGCAGFPVGPEGEAYAACVEHYRIACECQDPLVVGNGADDPNWACTADSADLCQYADARVCDAEDSMFDADACEGWHSRYTDEVVDFMTCYAREVRTCDVQAANDACAE